MEIEYVDCDGFSGACYDEQGKFIAPCHELKIIDLDTGEAPKEFIVKVNVREGWADVLNEHTRSTDENRVRRISGRWIITKEET